MKISPSVLLRLLSKLPELCHPRKQPSTPWLQFLYPLGIALDSCGQSEQHFQLLVEGLEDYGLSMLTSDGRVNSWNPGARNLTGYADDEMIA
jgi:PAS domain-containing protein